MSVYKVKESPYYHMDFVWRGHRIHRTTKCTSRREAEQVEREALEQAKKRITNQQAASTSLLLDHIIDRYWLEVGQHHVNANSTWKDLSRLIDYFGKDKLLNEIGDDDVARLVAWRRGHRVVHNKKTKPEDCPLISPATVNRTTTEVLKKLFTCAKTKWGLKFDREPNWRVHLLREPEERVRELVGDEGDRLEAATPEDYRAFFEFVRASGLRNHSDYPRHPRTVGGAPFGIRLHPGRQAELQGRGQRTPISFDTLGRQYCMEAVAEEGGRYWISLP